MTTTTAATTQNPLRRLRQRHPNKIAGAIALGVYAVLSHMILQGEGAVRFRVDLTPLLQSPLVLQAHVTGALVTFAIGCVLLAGVKGRAMHRTLGYVRDGGDGAQLLLSAQHQSWWLQHHTCALGMDDDRTADGAGGGAAEENC